MERKELIDEIADFCFGYGLLNETMSTGEIENIIETQLKESEFIESLINTIIIKTRNRKNIDVKKIKALLLELEKLRLELEYKELI